MRISLGHAIYGERDRGHRLLSASPSFPQPEALAGRMDMQGSPPPHTEWKPYLSGFAWNGHYVLARTMQDARSTRSGMVFSRALSMPADAIPAADDILGLMEFLADAADSRDPAADVDWKAGSHVTPGNAGLVQAALDGGAAPIVWPGQEGFDEALAALWSRLWPAARVSLSFRIAFSPTDVANEPPTVVTTPAALLSRWSGFRTVQADAAPRPEDPAERHLMAGEASKGLGWVVETLGIHLSRIPELRGLVEIDALLELGGNLVDYFDALRRIGHLAPDPMNAVDIKATLLAQAARSIADARVAEVRMARNLDLAAMSRPEPFWRALEGWTGTALLALNDAPGLAQLVGDALGEKPVKAWRDAVAAGLRQALAKPTEAEAGLLWVAMRVRPSLLGELLGLAGPTRRLAASLVAGAPARLEAGLADTLAGEARDLRIWELHAVCCARSLPPLEAVRRHLREAQADARSLAIAASGAEGADLVTIAVESDDELTLAPAAEAAAESPALLGGIDVDQPRWRALWARALAISPAAAAGPKAPSATVLQLMDGVVDGRVADPDLLLALSGTALADVARYPRREELWPKLPPTALQRFLGASADGFLSAVEAGEEVACDNMLADEVMLAARLDPALARLAASPGRGCLLFRTLPALGEHRFQQWFRLVLARTRPVTGPDAQALGRLIASRNWDDAARELADVIIDGGRADLRPAVDYVVELIGWFRRYYLDEQGNSIPVAAKWRILEDIALELYGYGPGDGGLWQRAGGKESDIPKLDTGKASWRKVLGDAEKGKADVDVGKLLKTMGDDYPNHRMLGRLRYDPLFRSGR